MEQPLTNNVVTVYVSPVEFLLGIADLSGELMRMAVRRFDVDSKKATLDICVFLRELHSLLTTYCPAAGREMQFKLTTMKQSIAKVETACYLMHVRGSELPRNLLASALTMTGGSDVKTDQNKVDYD